MTLILCYHYLTLLYYYSVNKFGTDIGGLNRTKRQSDFENFQNTSDFDTFDNDDVTTKAFSLLTAQANNECKFYQVIALHNI